MNIDVAALVEDLAKATPGVVFVPIDWTTGVEHSFEPGDFNAVWSIQPEAGGFCIGIRKHPNSRAPMLPSLQARHWSVDPVTAVLALRCIALKDTDERCPDCYGDLCGHSVPAGMSPRIGEAWDAIGHDWTWVNDPLLRRYAAELNRRWPQLVLRVEVDVRRYMYRRAPCRTCAPVLDDGKRGDPTGRVPRSWASVLLSAMPLRDCWTCDGFGSTSADPCECGCEVVDLHPGDDPTCADCGEPIDDRCYDCDGAGVDVGDFGAWKRDREEIAVKADELQSSVRDGQLGDYERSLGELLALWVDQTPCLFCAADGAQPGHSRVWDSTGRVIEHAGCLGTGLEVAARVLAQARLHALIKATRAAASLEISEVGGA